MPLLFIIPGWPSWYTGNWAKKPPLWSHSGRAEMLASWLAIGPRPAWFHSPHTPQAERPPFLPEGGHRVFQPDGALAIAAGCLQGGGSAYQGSASIGSSPANGTQCDACRGLAAAPDGPCSRLPPKKCSVFHQTSPTGKPPELPGWEYHPQRGHRRIKPNRKK